MLSTAIIVAMGSMIPDSVNPAMADGQADPETTPISGGKIRFPAPKNTANSAKPTTNASFVF